MAVQQWKTKLVRWQQLTRYYTNKWQYDGVKWAERIWYGTGTGKVPNAVASVPFMITRNMRAQLEQRGFPAHEISALLPKVAHELINEQVSYAQFQTQRARYETAQQQQQEQEVAAAVEEIKEIVATIQAREAQEAHGSDAQTVSEPAGASAANQIAIVPDQNDAKETHERL